VLNLDDLDESYHLEGPWRAMCSKKLRAKVAQQSGKDLLSS
jgi:hypothetical protein